MAVSPATKQSQIIKSLCCLCESRCGIDAEVQAGQLKAVSGMAEHPFNNLCIKGRHLPDWIHAKDRVTTPMKNTARGWQQISWDEALDTLAEKLLKVRDQWDARSLVMHLGFSQTGTHATRVAQRFACLFGTPNYTSNATLCFCARGIGHGLTLSRGFMPLSANYQSTRLMLVWGSHPAASNINAEVHIQQARRNGAKLIVADCRRTKLAEWADMFLQIRPGTDLALALGLLHVVVRDQLYDADFVSNWTLGFSELKEHLLAYAPEVVSAVTGVPADLIVECAREYATSKPAVIVQGVAVDHSVNGVQASRAIASLIAITDNFDVPGGNVDPGFLPQANLRVKGRVNPKDAIGQKFPLFGSMVAESSARSLASAILDDDPYPVRALIIQGANTLLTWPDTTRIREALGKLDLLVVSDLFLTPTAEMADIFIPAATALEQDMCWDYHDEGTPLVALGNKVIEPLGESQPDWRFWARLGERLGDGEYYPWHSDSDLIAELLAPSGITLDQLRDSPGGVLYADAKYQRAYRENGFGTPSGRVELYSDRLAEMGYDPLPTYHQPEMTDTINYPLTLTTGARVASLVHSQHRNIEGLRRKAPEPVVEVNPADAAKRGIASGDMVTVVTPRSSITLKAELCDAIMPGVLAIGHGWPEANVNELMDDSVSDPISGFPPYKHIACQLRLSEQA